MTIGKGKSRQSSVLLSMKGFRPKAALVLAIFLAAFLGCETTPSGNTNANDNTNTNVNDNGGEPTARLTCVECHNSKENLSADLERRATDHVSGGGSACGGSVTRAPAVDAVYVNSTFLASTHGALGCVNCHGGVEPAADRDEAHSGDFTFPVDPEQACAACHQAIVENFPKNIHAKFNNLTPDDPEYVERAAFHIQRVADDATLQQYMAEGIEIACAECHRVTCGSCHITLPEPSGGGFPNGATGHVIYKTPNTIYNCGACHGGRKAAEFVAEDINPSLLDTDLGEITLATSVHYAPGGMRCVDCHDSAWMHDQTQDLTESLRYEDPLLPTCEECHVDNDQATFLAANAYHGVHSDPNAATPYLQCQVCHAQPYPNCASCHVAPTDTVEPPPDLKFYTLKIAHNPFTTADFYLDNYPALGAKRPYDYSLVRRPAVVPDTFDAFADGVLANYLEYPTWKYATPHNIQLDTLATANGCDGCHDNDNLYLTEEYLRSVFTEDNFPGSSQLFLDAELQANASILIDR